MQSHCLRRYLLLAIFAATALGVGPSAQAQTWVQAGMLKCRLIEASVSSSSGISRWNAASIRFRDRSRPMRELLTRSASTSALLKEAYLLGGSLDQQVGCLTARSLESTSGLPAKLVSGPGVGANVLIGGSSRSVALQPVSLEGSAAVDVVAGLSQLKLRAARL